MATGTSELLGPVPQRFLVLATFSALSACNNFLWLTFAPIRETSAIFFGVSGDAIDWLSMIYMALYPFLFALAAFFVEADGHALRKGLRVAAWAQALGALLRWLSCGNRSFALLLLGQTVCAAAQGITLGAPPRIAALWFAERELGAATGAGVLANQVGPAVAYFLVPNVVSGAGRGFSRLLAWEFVVAVVVALSMLTIPAVPPRPPSAIAAGREQHETKTFQEFLASLRDICRPRPIRALSLGYCLAVGALYAVSTDLAILLPNESTGEVSLVGGAMLLAGLPGALLGGAVLDAWQERRYRLVLVVLAVGAAVAQAGLGAFRIALGAALGFLLCAVTSAGFEWGAELSFPAPESTVAGVLNVAAQIGGVALIYGVEGLARSAGARPANCFLAACCLGAACCFVAVGGGRPRRDSIRGTAGCSEADRLSAPADRGLA